MIYVLLNAKLSFLVSVCREHQFMDKGLLYRFLEDEECGIQHRQLQQSASRKECEDELLDTLQTLTQIGPDAMLRMILRKP